MLIEFGAVLGLLMSVQTSGADPVVSCPEDAQAAAITRRFSGLPEEVRREVTRLTHGRMGERPLPLLKSDVIDASNRDHLQIRFYRAVLLRDTWYVQIEHALEPVHTIGFYRLPNGDFQRSFVFLTGRPCEAIRAALSGVRPSLRYFPGQ